MVSKTNYTRSGVCGMESNVPEEPAYMSRAQTRDIDVSERRFVQVNRCCIVSIRSAHKPGQVDMSILPS